MDFILIRTICMSVEVHISISVWCGDTNETASPESFTFSKIRVKVSTSTLHIDRLLVTTPTHKMKKKTSAKFLSYITYHIHAGIYMMYKYFLHKKI